jgi:hypothetical protein
VGCLGDMHVYPFCMLVIAKGNPSYYAQKMETNYLCLPPTFMLVSCSAYSLTLKMEAICSAASSVDFQRTTQSYIPEDSKCGNYKFVYKNEKTNLFVYLRTERMRSMERFSLTELNGGGRKNRIWCNSQRSMRL